MISTSNHDLKEYAYLAVIPRGLQGDISSGLRKRAKIVVSSKTDHLYNDDAKDSNTNLGCGNSKSLESIECDDIKITNWSSETESETMRDALRDFSIQRAEQRKRQELHAKENSVQHQPNRIELEDNMSSSWLPEKCSVGSVKLSSSGQHVSIGYFPSDKRETEDKNSMCRDNSGVVSCKISSDYIPSWTCTGQLAGSVWMQLETSRRDVSQKVIAPSRMLGPLLALISVQRDNNCLEESKTTTANDGDQTLTNGRYQRYYKHSLVEMTDEVARHVRSDPDTFSKRFDRAFRVWKDCVGKTWENKLSPSEYLGLQDRIRNDRLRFRISCMRLEPSIAPSAFSRKKKKKKRLDRDLFSYSRQDLCLAIMDVCGPNIVPGYYHSIVPISDGQGSGSWTVNLEKFDIELVVLIIPPDSISKNGVLAFGFSLCPYSFLQSKSFASGQLPPDVTFPYIGGDSLSQGIIRLRPTTAHALLEIANPQQFDIVLDPCAGVGTIPVEAETFYRRFDDSCSQFQNNTRHTLSIGGDLILNNLKYTKVAGAMERKSRKMPIVGSASDNLQSSSLLVAWDAAHLPLRANSIDIVVSDLPFGQQCLSVTALNQLLPLIFLECSRVLTPITGRMVVLAGGSPISLIANIEKLSGKYWKKPIPRVSPVSIGGILAWIVRVDRNKETFDHNSIPEQLVFARKIAQKRDRISRQRKSDYGEQQTGKRRQKSQSERVN